MTAEWRHCSTCKKGLGFGQKYWACSVSTCNRKRTGLFFCSVACWDAHVPEARHREAWAVEETAPTEAMFQAQLAAEASDPDPGLARRQVVMERMAEPETSSDEVLVVVSKLKKYIKDRAGMNTSDGVMAVLSDHLRRICNQAIRNAATDDRKTVLERDFKTLT